MAPYPDLHATGLAVDPSSVLQSGGTVTVDWNDTNVGDAPASGSWYDQVTVVNTTTGQTLVNTNQTYIGNSIASGQQCGAIVQLFTCPTGHAGVGQLSITVTADAGGSLPEYKLDGTPDTNRSASVAAQSTLALYPDLHVAGLAVDPSSVLQSGGTVTVDWNDSNVGNASASGSWYDQVTVVNTTTSQTIVNTNQTYGGNSISAGSSAARSYSFSLPNGLVGVGQLSITVTADAGGNLPEYKQDGIARQQSFGEHCRAVDSRPLSQPGGRHGLGPGHEPCWASRSRSSWTDVNQGTAAATGSWVDRIYLYSLAHRHQPCLARQRAFHRHARRRGNRPPISATVNLPTNQAGSFYLGVTTDYFDQVIEASTVRQNTTISSQPTLIEAPDLVAESVQSSATTAQFGQPISVTWTVQNDGNAAATGSWSDQLYLSSQPTLNASAAAFYQQSESANAPLAVGASYSTTAQGDACR